MYLSSASINMTSGILEKGGCNVALIADNSWLVFDSWNNFGLENSFLSPSISDISHCPSLCIYTGHGNGHYRARKWPSTAKSALLKPMLWNVSSRPILPSKILTDVSWKHEIQCLVYAYFMLSVVGLPGDTGWHARDTDLQTGGGFGRSTRRTSFRRVATKPG